MKHEIQGKCEKRQTVTLSLEARRRQLTVESGGSELAKLFAHRGARGRGSAARISKSHSRLTGSGASSRQRIRVRRFQCTERRDIHTLTARFLYSQATSSL